MLSNSFKIIGAVLFSGTLLAQAGCACGTAKGSCVTAKAPCEKVRGNCDRAHDEVAAALPPNAKPGECYAKVFIPAQYKNTTERVLVRDASETIEIIPAKYEWVEEKYVVKDASTQLEAVPAEYASRERVLNVDSGHTDWEINKNELCVSPKGQPARDVFCLVDHKSSQRTIQTQVQVKPARVTEVCIPAQYETVRKQKLVSAATTRKVCIPAEYEDVQKSVKVCDARMAWQRVLCDAPNAEKVATSSNRPASIATVDAKSTRR